MRNRLIGVLVGMVLLGLAARALPGRGQATWPSEIGTLRQQSGPQSAQPRAQGEEARAEYESSLTSEVPGQVRLAERARDWAQEVTEETRTVVQDGWELAAEGEGGWLGVTVAEVTSEKVKELKLPAERGIVIAAVQAEGPAAKAGLKPNDVISEFNGQRVEGTAQFRRLVRETPAGRTAQLTIWRDGRSETIAVELRGFRRHLGPHVHAFGPKDFDFQLEMPELGENFFARHAPVLGIGAEDLGGQLGSYFGAPDGEGALVREVKPGSAAEKAGLKAGDVIIQADGQRVRTVGELREKLEEKRDKTIRLGLIRKGAALSLDVEIEQPRPPERKKLISRRAYL